MYPFILKAYIHFSKSTFTAVEPLSDDQVMYELNSGDHHHDDITCVKCNTIKEFYDENPK